MFYVNRMRSGYLAFEELMLVLEVPEKFAESEKRVLMNYRAVEMGW